MHCVPVVAIVMRSPMRLLLTADCRRVNQLAAMSTECEHRRARRSLEHGAQMRILVVGAGATGGYFGGRLAQAGRDVTFLVRPRRAAQLAQHGLMIRSPHGDFDLPAPATVLAEKIANAFDLVLLSCKAYDLPGAIAAFAPAVGAETMILPVLNGMRHLD